MVKSVRIALMASLLGTLTTATAGPASALVPQANGSLQQQLRLQDELITEIRAWAGAAPAPGMCWYYTDPSRTQGFWDTCP
jgi:hypothetical protein